MSRVLLTPVYMMIISGLFRFQVGYNPTQADLSKMRNFLMHTTEKPRGEVRFRHCWI